MPEITVKKNTIYLYKVFEDWDRPSNLFYLSKNLVLASKDKELAATGGVRWHAPPRNAISSVLSLRSRRLEVVGARKNGCLHVSPSRTPVLSRVH